MAAQAGFIGLMMADSGQSARPSPRSAAARPTGYESALHRLSERPARPGLHRHGDERRRSGQANVARAQGKPSRSAGCWTKDGKPTTNPNAQLEAE